MNSNKVLPPKVDDIAVMEVIYNSLIIVDEQDTSLLTERNWSYFSKYDKNYKPYVKLSDYDIQILKNLDNTTSNKQKAHLKIIKSDVNRRVFCKFQIRNCLSVIYLCCFILLI